MIDYVRAYAGRFGVEPILAVLNAHGIGIAPSTFYAHAARGFGPSETELEDAYLADLLFDLWRHHRRLYGRRKLWKAALRAGIDIGRDQVERLMRLAGIDGIRRGKRRTVTTESDSKAARHPDHVQRRWGLPTRPDQWWVADFTYVWTAAGFCYVSFITDVFPRRILGWRVSTSKATPLVTSGSSRRCSPGAARTWSSRPPACCITAMPAPWADSIGRRNTSIMEVFDGTTEEAVAGGAGWCAAAVGVGSGAAGTDALAGSARAVAGGAAGVLAADRRRRHDCRRRSNGWRVGAGRVALVPAR